MPMPRLRAGGAEAAVSEAGGGGRVAKANGKAGRRTERRAHGADGAGTSACGRHLCRGSGRVGECNTRGSGGRKRTLVRHALEQADVEVHPASARRARVSGGGGSGGNTGRRPAATHSSHSTDTPSMRLKGKAAVVCQSCGLRRIRLFSVSLRKEATKKRGKQRPRTWEARRAWAAEEKCTGCGCSGRRRRPESGLRRGKAGGKHANGG